jgi:hypothetical protein
MPSIRSCSRPAISPARSRSPPRSRPTLAELTLGEQLVVWALRKRLESAAHLPALQKGFRLAGAGAGDAYEAFERLFAALARNCRRELWFHRCGCTSRDELVILGLIGALQVGEIATAWDHGQTLVGEPAQHELLESALGLGRALAERRLVLPLRAGPRPDRMPPGARRH